jgi:hypothetical protein
MSSNDRPELTVEERARIAAQLAVHKERPRSEVLAPFGLSEQEWEEEEAAWTRRLTDEIRERAGSGVPIEQRYPLASRFAKAYSEAARAARAELVEDEREEDATVRIAPGASKDEPFSLLGASNRAARQVRSAR